MTRPTVEGEAWVTALREAGIPVWALPLIEIHALSAPVPLSLPGSPPAAFSALMFVSRAAVRCFLAVVPGPGPLRQAVQQGDCRLWVTGPGSAGELLGQGVAPERLDMPANEGDEFDSEALWKVVAHQVGAGFRLLIVRGRNVPNGQRGRSWLAEQVRSAGGEVAELLVYERARPVWSSMQMEQARRACADGSIWLFSSSQAIENLVRLLPGQAWGQARALTTHPRIAATARQAGFCVVAQSRPSLEAVIASIKSTDEFGESISTG